MASGALTVDRLCVVVHDLDAAAAHFEHLGFTLTPEGHHMVGSRNRCVMLQDGQYLELLDPRTSEPNPVSDRYQSYLSQHGEGLAVMSLRCQDAASLAATWQEAGLSPSPVRHFSRRVDLEGALVEAEFQLVQLPPEVLPGMPHLTILACHQMTPDLVWLPGTTDHQNGTPGISMIELLSEDPRHDAQVIAQLASTYPSRRTTDGRAVHAVLLGGVQIGFVDVRAEPIAGSSLLTRIVMRGTGPVVPPLHGVSISFETVVGD
ncbi:VOC family protein [Kribbella sp. CA-294648]|uniref:VOC family protein n=1 Tax=Kribbella sp. CA-294648 TaxID=3239948 RepID=UPI003D8A3CCF